MTERIIKLQSQVINDTLTSVEKVEYVREGLDITLCRRKSLAIRCNESQEISMSISSKSFADYSKLPFYLAFSPFFTCFKIAGLYYTRGTAKNITPLQVYCWIFAFVPFLTLAIEMSVFRLISSIDINFITLIVCVGFSLLCSANIIVCIRNAHNPQQLSKLFFSFERLNNYGGPYTQASQVNLLTKYCLILACVVYCFFLCLMSYAVVYTSLFTILLNGFGVPPTQLAVKISLVCVVTLMGLQWILPNCFELCLRIHLFVEYRKFYKNFAKKCRTNPKEFQETLEMDRKRYVEMSKIVEVADNILALRHGASFGCNLVILCLLLYSIAYYSKTAEVGLIIVLFVFFTCDIAFVCVGGILINVTVRILVISIL